MPTPTKFPAWLSQPGKIDAIVGDAASYNAAVAQGYVYPTQAVAAPSPVAPARILAAGVVVTPQTVVATSGALTTTIKQIGENGEQDDGNPWGLKKS